MVFGGYSDWLIVWILFILSIPAFLITVLIYKYLIKKKLTSPRIRYLTGVGVFIINLSICYLIVIYLHNTNMETRRAELYKWQQEQR